MSKWQKFLPFLLPLLIILIIVFLAWRWYRGQTDEEISVPDYSEGLAIENLSETELAALEAMKNRLGDYQVLPLTGAAPNQGEVRYLISDEKLILTLTASLGENSVGYRLWFLGSDSRLVKSQILALGKSGYTASLVLPLEVLPLSLYVLPDQAESDVAVATDYLLYGTINQ